MQGPADSRAAVPPAFAEPTFGQRLVARLIDGMVLLPVILLVGAVTDGRTRAAVGLAIVAVYEVAFVVRRGQTLGKMAMGTRIVDTTSGSLPSLKQSAMRWLVVIAGSITSVVTPELDPIEAAYTLIVLAPALRPPLHKGLHDYAAGTIVSSGSSVATQG